MKLTDDSPASDTITYIVDESLTIVAVNDAYLQFATDNVGGPDFRAKFGEGCQILDVIPAPLRAFYTDLYQRALNGEVVVHDYACHSPSRYRVFRLRLIPLDDGRIAAENSLHVDAALPDTLELDEDAIVSRYVAPSGLIIQCMHCRRIKTSTPPERWHMIPSFMQKRDDRISHGLCQACLELYYPE